MAPLRFLLPLAFSISISSGKEAAAPEKTPAATEAAVKAHAKHLRVKADFKAISSALLMYRINAGRFPTTEQGLDALINKPVKGPVPRQWVRMISKLPVDPWGFPYGYLVRKKGDKEQHLLISKGADRSSADDDIEHVIEPPAGEEAEAKDKAR